MYSGNDRRRYDMSSKTIPKYYESRKLWCEYISYETKPQQKNCFYQLLSYLTKVYSQFWITHVWISYINHSKIKKNVIVSEWDTVTSNSILTTVMLNWIRLFAKLDCLVPSAEPLLWCCKYQSVWKRQNRYNCLIIAWVQLSRVISCHEHNFPLTALHQGYIICYGGERLTPSLMLVERYSLICPSSIIFYALSLFMHFSILRNALVEAANASCELYILSSGWN